MSEIFDAYLIRGTLIKATPLLLAATGGLCSERSGVINFGLEGMMLCGAFFAVIGSYGTGHGWAGVLAGAIAGILLGLIHAVACLKLRVNQIVSSLAINISAIGFTGFLLYRVFGSHGTSPTVAKVRPVSLGWLGGLPVVGDLLQSRFLEFSPFVYIGLAAVGVVWVFLYCTPAGLRVRAVGERPAAAQATGLNVFRIRLGCVVASGLLAALAGAFMSIGSLSQFTERMSGGRGYMAIAALVFGKWRPTGVLLACVFFGFVDAFAENVQAATMTAWPEISSDLPLMLPFLMTLAVLVGLVGKATPPAGLGEVGEPE